MTSEPDIYVWAWLPNQDAPTPCGRLRFDNRVGGFRFQYQRKYLARADAISLWDREIPS